MHRLGSGVLLGEIGVGGEMGVVRRKLLMLLVMLIMSLPLPINSIPSSSPSPSPSLIPPHPASQPHSSHPTSHTHTHITHAHSPHAHTAHTAHTHAEARRTAVLLEDARVERSESLGVKRRACLASSLAALVV